MCSILILMLCRYVPSQHTIPGFALEIWVLDPGLGLEVLVLSSGIGILSLLTFLSFLLFLLFVFNIFFPDNFVVFCRHCMYLCLYLWSAAEDILFCDCLWAIDHILKVCSCSNRLWEFCEIYNLDAVGTDEFWGQKVKVQMYKCDQKSLHQKCIIMAEAYQSTFRRQKTIWFGIISREFYLICQKCVQRSEAAGSVCGIQRGGRQLEGIIPESWRLSREGVGERKQRRERCWFLFQ